METPATTITPLEEHHVAKDSTNNEPATKDAAKDSASKGSVSKDTASKDADPKDADPKDADPKGADPKDADPKDADPKDVVPKESDTPKDADTKDSDTSKDPTLREPANAPSTNGEPISLTADASPNTADPLPEIVLVTKTDTPEDAVVEGENDKQEPKRRHAYNFFVTTMRPQVKKENPGLSYQDIMKIVGAKWKALSVGERLALEEQALASKKPSANAIATEKEPESESLTAKQEGTKGGEEIQGKKRVLETDDQPANKKKCVTSSTNR